MRTYLASIMVLLLGLGSTIAQGVDFSGTWTLDREASRISVGTGISGLGAGGAPGMLYISQAASGVVIVGSSVNESQARTFKIAGGIIASEQPALEERFSLSGDGQVLTVVVTGTPAGAEAVTTTLVYKRAAAEEPCEKWPTPCRYASPASQPRQAR